MSRQWTSSWLRVTGTASLIALVTLLPQCRRQSTSPPEPMEVTCPSDDRKFTEEVGSRPQPGGATALVAVKAYLAEKYSQAPISGLTWTEELPGIFAGRLYEGAEVSAQVTTERTDNIWVVTKIVACGQDLGAEIPE